MSFSTADASETFSVIGKNRRKPMAVPSWLEFFCSKSASRDLFIIGASPTVGEVIGVLVWCKKWSIPKSVNRRESKRNYAAGRTPAKHLVYLQCIGRWRFASENLQWSRHQLDRGSIRSILLNWLEKAPSWLLVSSAGFQIRFLRRQQVEYLGGNRIWWASWDQRTIRYWWASQ